MYLLGIYFLFLLLRPRSRHGFEWSGLRKKIAVFCALGLAMNFGSAHAHAQTHAQMSNYHQVNPNSRQNVRNLKNEVVYTAEGGEIIPTTDFSNGTWAFEVDHLGGSSGDILFIRPVASKRVPGGFRAVRGYLDLPDDEVATVFKSPGKTWRDCRFDKSECIAWPHNRSRLTIIDSRFVEIIDPFTGEKRWQNFYRVKYEYTAKNGYFQSGDGWISSELISTEPVRVETKKDPACPEKEPPPLPRKDDLEQLIGPLKTEALKQTVQNLRPHIGQCFLKNPKTPPSLASNASAFDLYLMPHWKKAKPVTLKGGQRVSPQQLLEIDALARTIYGEMALCWGRGSHYLEAVAAVVKNRADYLDANPKTGKIFTATVSEDPKHTPLTKVISAQKQFSVWNARHGGKPNNGLRHVLCPPADASKNFWKGEKPSPIELQIWERTLEIATKAVLYPDEFNHETRHVTQYYYTSNMGKFMKGFTRRTPSINGMKLSRGQCIELWDPPKTSPLKPLKKSMK